MYSIMGLKENLYGNNVELRADIGFCKVLSAENESGEGIITCYAVDEGIELIYNDFHMESWHSNKNPISNIVEINHCREGRFECEFKDKTCVYLEKDNLAVNMLTNTPKSTCFPLRHYQGISVLLDIVKAQKSIDLVVPDAPNIRVLMKTLCGHNKCCIIRECDSIKHIFSELYTVPSEIRRGYIKLKVVELILFLSSINPNEISLTKYYCCESVQKVKEIKKLITENPQKHYTLEQLSERFDISVSSLKNSFKGVYNQPVYTFLKGFRMNMAAELLKTVSNDVTEIAMKVGYSNPSKFSAAFMKAYGCTPSEFRKNNRMD